MESYVKGNWNAYEICDKWVEKPSLGFQNQLPELHQMGHFCIIGDSMGDEGVLTSGRDLCVWVSDMSVCVLKNASSAEAFTRNV